jgi:hypothetical protein
MMTKHYDPYDYQKAEKIDITDKLTIMDSTLYDKIKNFEIFVVDGEVDEEDMPLYQGFIWDNDSDMYIYQTDQYYTAREAMFEAQRIIT